MPDGLGKRRIITLALVAWNALGVVMWALQSFSSPEALAKGDKVTMEVWQAMPTWAWAAYALATWSGLAGAVALLMHRRIASWLFAASALGVVVQFSYALVLSPLVTVKGPGVVVFPAVILLIALGGMTYAHSTTQSEAPLI